VAFGGLRGTLSIQSTSVTNPFSATGSVAVSVGDLVVAFYGERPTLTISAISDNLGNTYTAQNAGTDSGNATGRLYYSRVTAAGTLTTVDATTTASANDAVFIAACFEGPFTTPPIDTNPANISNDTTTPFACPATGTLAQSVELVVCAISSANYRIMSATSPNLLALNLGTGADSGSGTFGGAVGYQVTAATTSVAPEFTAPGSAGSTTLHTASFKQAAATKSMPPIHRPLRTWNRVS
jgi:hypothetical protein